MGSGAVIIALVLAGFMVASLNLNQGAVTIYAATLQDLTNKKNELQKAIDDKQKEAAKKKAQADSEKKRQNELAAAIRKIDGDINTTESKIKQTEREVKETQDAITTKLEEITVKEAEITDKKTDTLETAAVYYIAIQQGSTLYAVLGSDRISKVLDETNNLNGLYDKLVIDAENLNRERELLLTKKAELQQKEQDLNTRKNQLAAYQRALDSQKEQKAELADESKQAQKQFLAESGEALKSSEQLKKQFAAVANEEAAMRRAASKRGTATASRGVNPSSLGFIWPTDGDITTNFGGRTPFQNFHTGLDIAASAGDPILAAAAGTVTTATTMCCSDYSNTVDKSYGYGNWIEIQHDNGYVTRYAHLMEFTVSPGSRVERGQTIGYRGGGRGMRGAGWSTGPHLHFEVWDSGPFDPLEVLP